MNFLEKKQIINSILEFTDLKILKIVRKKYDKCDFFNYDKLDEETLSDLLKLTLNSFCDEDYAFNTINKYIDKNFQSTNDYENNVKFLKILETKLQLFNYTPNKEVIKKLLYNNINLQNIVKLIFEKNKEIILSGNLSSLFDSFFIKILIEKYCTMKNIKIIKKDINQTNEDKNRWFAERNTLENKIIEHTSNIHPCHSAGEKFEKASTRRSVGRYVNNY